MATIKPFSEYIFDAVAPNATAELKFIKPVKRIYTSTPIMLVDDTKTTEIGYLPEVI